MSDGASRAGVDFFDAGARASLDRLVRLACNVLEAPVGLLAVVDRDRHFRLAACGLSDRPGWAGHAGGDDWICRYPVASGRPLIVGNTRARPVPAADRASSEMGVRAYAGVPLRDPDGRAFATLCVMDVMVRDWDDHQLAVLARLADIATEVCLADQSWSLASEEGQRVAPTSR